MKSAEKAQFLYASSSLPSPSVHKLQLAGGEGQDPADVVGDAQRQEGNDHQQQQDPPEAQILHKLLPGGPEARQDALAALQVGVQERVALHGTEEEKTKQQSQEIPTPPTSFFFSKGSTQSDKPFLMCFGFF